MEDVYAVFLKKINFWRHHEFVRMGWVSIVPVISGSGWVRSEIWRLMSQKIDPWASVLRQ